jgi:hypothetical protein
MIFKRLATGLLRVLVEALAIVRTPTQEQVSGLAIISTRSPRSNL